MPAPKLHADEADIDARLVRRLLAGQFPQWAGLDLERFESAGTSNAIYRLGPDLAVRLPLRPSDRGPLQKEHEWLPRLAPLLPLATPVPLAMGEPAEGYPWHWSVYRWLEGETPAPDALAGSREAARALGEFVAALQRADTTDAPPVGTDNYRRGIPLATRDAATRRAIAELGDRIDGRAATGLWEAALAAPSWDGPPLWFHGDLLPGNLLVDARGHLTSVIDFGLLGVGDPACDVMAAWSICSGETRGAFRASLAVADDATWTRGHGWALSIALIALPYYWDTNPAFASVARRVIAEVLADGPV